MTEEKCAICSQPIPNVGIMELNGKPVLRHDECPPKVDPQSQVGIFIHPGALRGLAGKAVKGGGHKMIDATVVAPGQKAPEGWIPIIGFIIKKQNSDAK